MRTLLTIATLTALSAVAAAKPLDYSFDKVHTQVHASVLHMGFSNSTARFHVKDGTIRFDPADVGSATVDVTLDATGLDLGDATWKEHVSSPKWFDVAQFPDIRFVSKSVTSTGATTFDIAGELTLKGVTKPVTLKATLNKAGEHPFSKKPAAGFSATATFKRSDFGVSEYIPAISDEVNVRIEVESAAG